ncbi:MAG TPA: transposase, partial [Feifaniaceae bacterium]|nr:transposase [Feifaniaceae bacterium]
MGNDTKSLSHTKWNCKYHIVFAPKYRRKIFFGEKRVEIGKIFDRAHDNALRIARKMVEGLE